MIRRFGCFTGLSMLVLGGGYAVADDAVAPGSVSPVAHEESLAAFVGDEFHFSGRHPLFNVDAQWIVTVDADLSFQIVGMFIEWSEHGAVCGEAIDHDRDPSTPPVTVAAALQLAQNEVLWLWSEALGGNVVYTQDDSLPPADRKITFFAPQFVAAGDAELFPSRTSEVAL